MDNQIDECPYCQRPVVKGAMRCVACGKILQTTEERIDTLEKLQSKKKFNVKRLLKWTVMIIISGVLYYYYSEKIIEIIRDNIGDF